MKIIQAVKNSRDFLPRIFIVVSIAFFALSIILLILGNKLLKDSTDNVLEQRLVIAQMVASQIEGSLEATIIELEQTLQLANFDPSDPNLSDEEKALADLYAQLGHSLTYIVFLDPDGRIVLTYPPDHPISGTNLTNHSNIAQAINGENIFISTPFRDSPTGDLLTAITIPVFDKEHILAWLCGVIDLNEPSIKALLIDAVALDHTAHAVLVDSQGRSLISTFDLPFLSPGEHQTFYRRAIAQGQPMIEEVPFELDLPGEPSGHHHIMAIVPLVSVPWGVAVGGDVFKETFAESYLRFLWPALFFFLAVFAVWGVTLISARKLLEPANRVNLKFDISEQIANTKDWEELKSLIVRIPATFLPVTGTRLLLSENDSGGKVIAEWSSDDSFSAFPGPSLSSVACETCALTKESSVRYPILCSHRVETPRSGKLNSFCLPLVHQDSLIGTLHFCLPYNESLSENQIDVLTGVAPNMAIAIDNAQLQRSNLDQIEITQAEQRRIFRRLHDTLGQNITFLRLKLDQYSTIDSPASLSDIQREIEEMSKIAEEAHEQIRNILTDIHPETQTDLISALRARGSAVAERAHFNFDLTVKGRPVKISQKIKRHVLFICHEALNNIEKHAQAKNATIRLLWGKDDLTVIIADDGSGFDLQNTSPAEHFGLEIMQERTHAINGRLTIIPSPSIGTEVNLWIPLSDTTQY